MKRLVTLTALISFSPFCFSSFLTLGNLTRNSSSPIIESAIGLDFMNWATIEQHHIEDWEASFIDTNSIYFGWRIADANEAFGMLQDARISVYDWRRTSTTGGVYDIPWGAECYDNNSSTTCTASDRWGANFDYSLNDIRAISEFFTGSVSGFNDSLHNSIIFKGDAIGFANSLDNHTYGAFTTHLDGGGYVNGTPSGYTLNDVNSALTRPLGGFGWRPLLVRDSIVVSEPSLVSLMLIFIGYLRKNYFIKSRSND